jgi:uncharacterized membrane protein
MKSDREHSAQSLPRGVSLSIRSLLRRLKDRPIYIVLILIAIYVAYFSSYTIIKHWAFHTHAYDFGIYMQSLWTTLHGHGLFYTSLWEGSRFFYHFEPILFFILPLYAIFTRAETLLVLQSLVIALGAIPIYWIARDELGEKAGVAFAALFLLYPALHGVNQDEFHGVALAITPLLFSFYMFKKKRYGWGVACALLALMCRENVSMVVIFMGLYWLWVERDKVKLWLRTRSLPREREVVFPLCLVLIGIIWFTLAVFVIIPHFNHIDAHPFSYRYDSLFRNLFTDFGMKLTYLLCLFAPLAFIPLLCPSVLLIGLPIFAQNLFSGKYSMYIVSHHYCALLIPWIFIAGIYGFKRLLTMKRKDIYSKLFYPLLPLGLIITFLVAGPSPVSLTYDVPQITSHDHTVERIIELVPEGASVYAQNDIFPHICHRPCVYQNHCQGTGHNNFFDGYLTASDELVPWSNGGNFDYILVDDTTTWSVLKRADDDALQRMRDHYHIIAYEDGVYLFQRNGL